MRVVGTALGITSVGVPSSGRPSGPSDDGVVLTGRWRCIDMASNGGESEKEYGSDFHVERLQIQREMPSGLDGLGVERSWRGRVTSRFSK